MKLLAISGGVDSMVLADKYKNKQIVLAFVNYNIRHDTNIDQKIVEEFASKNNLILEKLIIQKERKIEGNFENWAREIRYNFFRKIYEKYQCDELLIAHHKDDFLETCLMQEEKNMNKFFYGMKKKCTLYGMRIYRPFLDKYWKHEIYEIAMKNQIKYHEDYTNHEIIFKRNSIRAKLAKKNVLEKEQMLQYFYSKNKNNEQKVKELKIIYKEWRKTNFMIHFLLKQNPEIQKNLLIFFINKRKFIINISNMILSNLIAFLRAQNNSDKKFLLSNDNYLIKKNKKICIIKM